MINRRGIVSAMAAVWLFLAAGLGGMSSLAAEKPEYLKAVTYFGDQWPVNYWNSEDKAMDANLAQIAADGFNGIILVVPWREFQPSADPVSYNSYPFERLDQVMDCAGKHGLWVCLRVGYCWDYSGDAGIPPRYSAMLRKDSRERAAWLDYCRTLYEAASSHSNFYGGFITWEDFWNYTYSINAELSARERTAAAQESGYADYLKERYSIRQVGRMYGEDFEEFSQVYLPRGDQAAAALFYEFYDQFLMELLEESQGVFPELSMEVRADGDVVYDRDGNQTYYSHELTYQCEGAPYTALMYSVSMGQENDYERLSSGDALRAMEGNLAEIQSAAGGKKLFIDQLLYMDTTEEFSYNAQIAEDQVGTFITQLGPLLSRVSSGYGLWVYRNYVNNSVFNPQFGIGEEGWKFSGGSGVKERGGTPMGLVADGGAISQNLSRRLTDKDTVYVDVYADSESGADLTVKVGDYEREVRITGPTRLVYSVPWSENCELRFTADGGEVYVDDIQVYIYEQNGRIYDSNGAPMDLAESFRTLNRELN